MDDPFWIQIAQYVVPDFMGHIMGNHRSDGINFFSATAFGYFYNAV
jgi:hypothetical protein